MASVLGLLQHQESNLPSSDSEPKGKPLSKKHRDDAQRLHVSPFGKTQRNSWWAPFQIFAWDLHSTHRNALTTKFDVKEARCFMDLQASCLSTRQRHFHHPGYQRDTWPHSNGRMRVRQQTSSHRRVQIRHADICGHDINQPAAPLYLRGWLGALCNLKVQLESQWGPEAAKVCAPDELQFE